MDLIKESFKQKADQVSAEIKQMLKEHGHQVSTIGIDGLRASALMLVGLILGAMVAWSDTPDPARHKPLAAALLNRLGRLTAAFEAVVFAQVKISALNTALAAICWKMVFSALMKAEPLKSSDNPQLTLTTDARLSFAILL